MTGNKILLMSGTKLLRKSRNRKICHLIREVSSHISLVHLKDQMPPIGAESLLKRRGSAKLNPNGTNLLFRVPVESKRLKIELLLRLPMKFLGTMPSLRVFIVTPPSKRSSKKKQRNSFLLKAVANTKDQ